ncbi:hypothetical protein [Mesorhizobium sp. M7A.F.Ca.MR.362.00.0.0]|uniref:hypothetical protein n=1 Tax=Mesorhizobium sp. M7A.F.Ca.MR.362.00.0.0 TaxID=2496779 RepID=UPI000FD2C6C6|nr:hypothetical protein [Mesorhizobium sp. M7A.F.Ca.MR.362.00.0.0]RUU74945.1 hypothetical protein EOC06_32100 [Mesorhizobium sp. M7A.F.Ca.MR.362.00.0.0]RWN95443.1 MAG: hypothetical protein EOS05_11660 [Mesorhizobium sp.]
MIKLLAETKGSFQLHDLAHQGQRIHARRPSVIENSHFIQDRIGRGQVRIIGELKAEATDEAFVAYMKEAEGDMQFAIDAFMAEYGAEAAESADQPRKRASRKPKETKTEGSEGGADA